MTADLPDEQERENVVNARKNVFIPAGAGTGKTYTLVSRIIELAAPEDSRHEPMDIEQIAAITFTRRAAGELKSRIRSRCLSELADEDSERNPAHLRTILERMDYAFIGTIHSFADRLLRRRPVESGLSPDYDVIEDTDQLQRETFERLMSGVYRDRLREELPEQKQYENLEEIKQTIVSLVEGGIPEEDLEFQYGSSNGIESLVADFLQSRDLPELFLDDTLSVDEIHAGCEWILDQLDDIEDSPDEYPGIDYILNPFRKQVKEIRNEENPSDLFCLINDLANQAPVSGSSNSTYGPFHYIDDLNNNKIAKGILKSLRGDSLDSEASPDNPTLEDQIVQPIRKWMASKLMPVRNVVIDLYEKRKREEGVVDQLDLLMKLRDVLRKEPAIRNEFKESFQHIFVDEFQDTDPLQAEILFFLAESRQADGTEKNWENVQLEENILTLVGDPKQSIFRFRRADIQTFAKAVKHLLNEDQNPPSETELLKTNFRSGRNIINVINHAFSSYMGEAQDPDDPLAFNQDTGEAFYQNIQPHPACEKEHQNIAGEVCLFSYNAESQNIGPMLKKEGKLVAEYIDWLVNESGKTVRAPESSIDKPEQRPIKLSDIAILGQKSTKYDKYLSAFAERGIACTVAGGSTFMDDPLIKQFILALRAISDPKDGPARAALERPPFFSVDYDDLLAKKYADHYSDWTPEPERLDRANQMEELIGELRKKRLSRPPVQTVLELIEQSGVGRYLASKSGGFVQRTGLYHVAARVDTISRQKGLDYDGVTAVMRDWLDNAPRINAPSPLDEEAVHLQTLYQAKGLEYPIVFLFHGATKSEYENRAAYSRDPYNNRGFFDVKNFEMNLDRASLDESWEEKDKQFELAENRRKFYVAATRARDQLVIPWPHNLSNWNSCVYKENIFDEVIDLDGVRTIHAEPGLKDDEEKEVPSQSDSAWQSTGEIPNRDGEPEYSEELEEAQNEQLNDLNRKVEKTRKENPSFRSVTEYLQEQHKEAFEQEREEGRHGPEFGSAVHEVLDQVIQKGQWNGVLDSIIEQYTHQYELPDHQNRDLKQDVERTLNRLKQENLHRDSGTIRTEYPIHFRKNGDVITGILDFVRSGDRQVTVIDFKTGPAADDLEEIKEKYPHYNKQLELYKEALKKHHSDAKVTVALFFTATGTLIQKGNVVKK